MNLGQKTLAIIFLTVAGLMAVLYVATRILIERSFLALEQRETRNALERAQNALNDDVAGLAATANDYGAWNRTYDFMLSGSPPIRHEFENGALQGLSINSVLIMDTAGKIVFFKAYDINQKREIPTSPGDQLALASDSWTRQAGTSSGPQTGIVVRSQGPVMIAACPILTSQRTGPARGVLVMTRDLDQARVERLKTVTRSALSIQAVSNPSLPVDFRQTLQPLESGREKSVVKPLGPSVVAGYALLRDVRDNPILILQLEAPRTIFREGLTSLHYFLGALCLASIAFGTTSLLLLQRAVIAPLSRLSGEVSQIGERRKLSARVTIHGRDEVGNLAAAINHMLQALEKSDAQFRHIAENIHQVFWIEDAQSGELQYINLAYESVWGRSREELYKNPHSWLAAIHEEDREMVAEMRLQQKRGKIGVAEFRVVHPDGTIHWICDRYFPVIDDDGHTRQIAGLAEDITEYRKAEQVLRRSHEELETLVQERTAELGAVNEALAREEERFRQLFGTIPIPVWLYSESSHRFLEVNEAALHHYGYNREEFLRMKLEDIRPPEEVGQLEEDLSRPRFPLAFSRGWKHRTKDGTLIDVEISSHRIEFSGAPAILVAVQDVTERMRMEVELRHGQKLQAVGELAAGIAHEINTPIQFVGDNVQFLQGAFSDLMDLLEKHEKIYESLQSYCGPEQKNEVTAAREVADLPFLRNEIPPALEQTVQGVGRVTTIVQALRKFSHMDWGPEKATANLNDALESTLVVAASELKYVADVLTVFGELPPVKCHLGDLNQVFLNLLVNAAHAITDVVKDTGKRGQIRVETSIEDTWAVVAISDTGTGIPAEIRERVFDPFFTTKAVGKGTGQGLALARAIVVEKHGGTLTFDSEMGKGTTFYIRIPLNPPEPAEHQTAAADETSCRSS